MNSINRTGWVLIATLFAIVLTLAIVLPITLTGGSSSPHPSTLGSSTVGLSASERAYLNGLDERGVNVDSTTAAVGLAHDICGWLDEGLAPSLVVDVTANAGFEAGYSPKDVAAVLYFTTTEICPRNFSKVDRVLS